MQEKQYYVNKNEHTAIWAHKCYHGVLNAMCKSDVDCHSCFSHWFSLGSEQSGHHLVKCMVKIWSTFR